MSIKRIMVVEDNETNMKLATAVLELHNYVICCAVNANEALQQLSHFLPDAILVDIQLPDIDGLTLTKKIRANPLYKNIFIIAVTAYAMEGDREKTLAAGCDEYVAKPADIFEIVKIIEDKITTAKISSNIGKEE